MERVDEPDLCPLICLEAWATLMVDEANFTTVGRATAHLMAPKPLGAGSAVLPTPRRPRKSSAKAVAKVDEQ